MSTTNWDNTRWGRLASAMNSFADMSAGWLHPVSSGMEDLGIIVRSSMDVVLKKGNTGILTSYFSTSTSSLLDAFWNLAPQLEKYLHFAAHYQQQQQQQKSSSIEDQHDNGSVVIEEVPQEEKDASESRAIPSPAELIVQRETSSGTGDDPPAEHIETMEEEHHEKEAEEHEEGEVDGGEDLSLVATSSEDPMQPVHHRTNSDSVPSVVNSRPPPVFMAPAPEPPTSVESLDKALVIERAAPVVVEESAQAAPVAEKASSQDAKEAEKKSGATVVSTTAAVAAGAILAGTAAAVSADTPSATENVDEESSPVADAIMAAAAKALDMCGGVDTVVTNSDDDDNVTEMTEPLLEEDSSSTPATPRSPSSSLAGEEEQAIQDQATAPEEELVQEQLSISASPSVSSEDRTETSEEQEEQQEQVQPVHVEPVKAPATPRVITKTKRYSYEPKELDWAYASFAAPHKAIRRELTAMVASIDEIRARQKGNSRVHSWQVAYFCEWVVDWFGPAIREHHDNEQELFFPFLATKLTEQHHDLADAHDEIITRLNRVCSICENVLVNEGKFSSLYQIEDLQEEIHCFHNFYCDVMYEEEKTMPAPVRKHFTEQEVMPVLEQMYARGGTEGLARSLLPSMMLGEESCWAAKTSRRLSRSLSKPLRKSFSKKVMPDHLNCVIAKRDAPFLEREPDLERSQH